MHKVRGVVLGAWAVAVGCGVLACSARMGLPELEPQALNDAAADAGADAKASKDAGPYDEVQVDSAQPPAGVDDLGRDPAVLLVRSPSGDCSAVLVAKDLLVTARSCVRGASPLPSTAAEALDVPPAEDENDAELGGGWSVRELAVFGGDAALSQPPLAYGIEVLREGEIEEEAEQPAFVLLDRALSALRPLGWKSNGVALEQRVRAVAHASGSLTPTLGARVLREHVRVSALDEESFSLQELSCRYLRGGAVLDAQGGQLLGLLSQDGACEGDRAHNRYVRLDRFVGLYERALARSGLFQVLDKHGALPIDVAPRGASAAGSRKPPSEVGAPCASGAECASGVCVREPGRSYCSRACGRGDRCPTNYRCEALDGAAESTCALAPK